jgi:hypothetical protein
VDSPVEWAGWCGGGAWVGDPEVGEKYCLCSQQHWFEVRGVVACDDSDITACFWSVLRFAPRALLLAAAEAAACIRMTKASA